MSEIILIAEGLPPSPTISDAYFANFAFHWQFGGPIPGIPA